MPRCALAELLAFDLGRERLRGAEEAADRAVLEVLRHELHPRGGLRKLFGHGVEVRLIAREPVDGVADDHVDAAVPDRAASGSENLYTIARGGRMEITIVASGAGDISLMINAPDAAHPDQMAQLLDYHL